VIDVSDIHIEDKHVEYPILNRGEGLVACIMPPTADLKPNEIPSIMIAHIDPVQGKTA